MFRSSSYRPKTRSCKGGRCRSERGSARQSESAYQEAEPFFQPRQAPYTMAGGGPKDKRAAAPGKKPADKFSEPQPATPVIPQLKAVPSYFENEGCSDATFGINWDLSANASPKGGFIVQEVSITQLVFDCNMNLVQPKGKNPIHYFEAWPVAPNSKDVLPENSDGFHFNVTAKDGTAHTHGMVSFSAVAHYHDNVSPEDMPDHMVRHNRATKAGLLLSSTQDPKLGGNVSNATPHELNYHWSCCTRGMSPNIIDHQTPS